MLDFDWNSIAQSRSVLLTGMWVTLRITAVAIACGFAFGTVLAAASLVPSRMVRAFVKGYVSLFRSIPLIMLLLWFFLIVPQLLKAVFDLSPSVDVRLVSAMVAFALLESAFFCEIMRAGIDSLPRGQFQAARALGLSTLQSLRYVVLPQALRAMLPVILTQCIVIFQDTSLVYVIGLSDFFGTAYKVGDRDGRLVELLLFAGLIYFVICFSASQLVKRLQARFVK